MAREESLRRIHGGRPLPPPEEFRRQCDSKNARYVEYIGRMAPADILPGSVELLEALRREGIRSAIASASKNGRTVLERTGLAVHADAVVDGTDVAASKPDPQGFLLAAKRLGLAPPDCVGVEDAESGVEAIHRAGMLAVGIGPQAAGADLTVAGVHALSVQGLKTLYKQHMK